ncbi:hypothetical protein [Dinghuibacter silviterrae]|uniref:DUF3592 domain-containing protein n=1 Tax=Dinghuibacter silviterrae TaxID=1539049 RepID=A0A4R8DIZ8_9BACT|nr:hypothetical protein [Dinghuibacter silviterrae]TDW97537.1 hypothetical protein EDB95_5387 [Dinghuibacter silviterrae]
MKTVKELLNIKPAPTPLQRVPGVNKTGRIGAAIVVSFIIIILFSYSIYADYKVYTEGTVVTATIISNPGGRSSIVFSVDGQRYSAKSHLAGHRLNKGDTIPLKFNAGYPEHAMMPGYNPIPEDLLIMGVFIVLFGTCFLMGFGER